MEALCLVRAYHVDNVASEADFSPKGKVKGLFLFGRKEVTFWSAPIKGCLPASGDSPVALL